MVCGYIKEKVREIPVLVKKSFFIQLIKEFVFALFGIISAT